MADARHSLRANGFSMVEMLVALVFTLVLMAGMASVFKASLGTFYTSGEALSSARRNRMSMDQLGDDLNTACMYLIDPNDDPQLSATNPAFYVLPNMPIAGAPTSASPGLPTTADQLFFYMDQPLPFPASLSAPSTTTAGQLAQSGALPTAADYTFSVQCDNNPSYAQMVASTYAYDAANGLPAPWLIFMDNFASLYIAAAPTVTGSVVSVVTGASPTSGITGIGSPGTVSNTTHLQNASVLFVQAQQMVRYSVAYLQLDPNTANTVGIPCLVRDQGTYSGAGFVANQPQQIITENISGFKVYLSVNSGSSWAGYANPAQTYSGFAAGWTAGLLTELSTQLAAEVTSGWTTPSGVQATSITNNTDWFRYIPTLVRVDVTTRSAASRTEYASAANTSAYKLLTQSLVFVPRHSGLTLN